MFLHNIWHNAIKTQRSFSQCCLARMIIIVFLLYKHKTVTLASCAKLQLYKNVKRLPDATTEKKKAGLESKHGINFNYVQCLPLIFYLIKQSNPQTTVIPGIDIPLLYLIKKMFSGFVCQRHGLL